MIMSMLSHAIFLWVLLASIEHPCSSARHGTFNATAIRVHDEDSLRHSNISNKKEDGHKMNLIDAQGESTVQEASSAIRKSSNNKDNSKKEKVNIRVTPSSHKRQKRSSRKKNSGRGGVTKLVTYIVPRRNQEDQQESFTLDYSPPKVHPPHHN